MKIGELMKSLHLWDCQVQIALSFVVVKKMADFLKS